MFKVIALLLMSIFFVSCGDKKGVSAVKLKLFQSSITSGTNMDGGVLLVGKSEDGLNSFRTSLEASSDSISLTLPKGRWEFAAIAWASVSGPMTGENRCAFTGYIDLKDPDVNVSLNLTQARCLTDFDGKQFSAPSYITSAGRFLDFFPVMCNENVSGNAGCYYVNNPSNILSYKVIYKSEIKGAVTGAVSSLSSNCLTMNVPPRVKIPITDDINGSPLNVTTIYFKNATCTGNPDIVYDFKNGIKGNQLPVWNEVTYAASYYSYFYVNPGVQFDATIVEPTTIGLGALDINGIPTIDNLLLGYNLGGIPLIVSDVCLSLTTTCTPAQWTPVSLLTGDLMLDNSLADGNHTLYVSYRTYAGNVSTTRLSQPFAIDMTAPFPPVITPSATATNIGLNVSWTSADLSSFLKWKIEICADASCGTIKKTVEELNSSIKFLNLTVAQFGEAIPLGQNYCFRVTTQDKFLRFGISNTYCVVSTQVP